MTMCQFSAQAMLSLRTKKNITTPHRPSVRIVGAECAIRSPKTKTPQMPQASLRRILEQQLSHLKLTPRQRRCCQEPGRESKPAVRLRGTAHSRPCDDCCIDPRTRLLESLSQHNHTMAEVDWQCLQKWL